jgi:hypothetical protein
MRKKKFRTPRSVLILLAVLLLLSASLAWAVYNYFGQTGGTIPFGENANYMALSRFQSTFTGAVDSIAMEYQDNDPQSNVKYAIYSDTGAVGYPCLCLDSTASASTAGGWRKLKLTTGVQVTINTYYWLAFRHSALYDSVLIKGGPDLSKRYKSGVLYNNSWPSPIPSEYSGANSRENIIAFSNPP